VVIYAIDGILAELDHDVLLEVVLSRGVFFSWKFDICIGRRKFGCYIICQWLVMRETCFVPLGG